MDNLNYKDHHDSLQAVYFIFQQINELFVQQNVFSVLLNLTNSHLPSNSSYYTS